MIVAFIATLFINKDLYISPELYGIIIVTIGIMLFGLWDDLVELHWKIQLFFQIAISLFIFLTGVRIYYITNPFSGGILNLDTGMGILVSVFLVIIWIMWVVNAINWVDGADGLSGGITFISALTIFFLSLKSEVNQPPVAIIAAIVAGVSLGFLIFNFYPSRVLAGTTGSMFMGFILAVLSIFAGTKIATALVVMAIPIVDSIWVIKERFKNKQSIFFPDKNHLHYKLLDLGWSQRKIALYYYGFTVLVAIVALNTRIIGKSITLVMAFFMIGVIYMVLNRKTLPKNNEKKT